MGKEQRSEQATELVSELLAHCYDDVRRIARRMIASDGQRRVFQATELANEAMMRLMSSARVEVADGAHMLALAARTMRRVLIDEARKGLAVKRQTPPMLTAWPDDPTRNLLSIHDLDRALVALEQVSTDHAEVVELRFMLGLTVEETSRATGVPERTIKRRWSAARAWLLDHLEGGGDA